MFYLEHFFQIPPENPQDWNFFPRLIPPSAFGLESWNLFHFVQNLVRNKNTIQLYQIYIPKKTKKKHFFCKVEAFFSIFLLLFPINLVTSSGKACYLITLL